MKKKCIAARIVTILIVMLIIGGCKKTKNQTDLDTSGKYYISFKANGKQIKYTIPVDVDSLPVIYNFVGYSVNIWELGAVNIPQYDMMALTIITEDSLPQAGKTYKESNITSGIWHEVMFTYSFPGEKTYWSISTGVTPADELYPGIPKDCTITLTEVGSATLKGTFSGTVYAIDDNGETDLTNKIKITDGIFYLPASF